MEEVYRKELAEKLLIASMSNINQDVIAKDKALMVMVVDNCYELARLFILKGNE